MDQTFEAQTKNPRSKVVMMASRSSAETDLEDNYFEDIEMAPPDAILKLSTGYNADKDPRKVNLGIGAYRDDNGKPYVFPVVKKAESNLEQGIRGDNFWRTGVAEGTYNKEYSTITGDQTFNKGARGVLFGWDHPDVNSGRVCTS